MKKTTTFFTLILAITFLVFLSSCEKDENGVDSVNNAPVMDSLTADPGSGLVDLEETSTLTVYAHDPDNDPLEFTWDATAGNFDTTGGTTVIWTAPDEALQSTIIVWASDGVASVDTSYTFYYDNFAPGPPEIDSIYATPAHIYVAAAGSPDQWFIELFARIADGSADSRVIRVTAEPPSGTILNLRDDGIDPDPVADDNEFTGFPGSHTMVVDTGWVEFIATNQYYENAVDSFHIDVLCDSLPTVVPPDSLIGDIYGYASGAPVFAWNSYSGAEYFTISISDMEYNYIWQPTAQLTDTTAAYNFDYSATLVQLALNQDYIFHLRVDKGNSWAKREQIIRRIE